LFTVFCVLGLVLGAFIPAARAQDDDAEEEGNVADEKDETETAAVQGVDTDDDDDEEEEALGPHKAVSVSHFFPNNVDKRLPAGEQVDVLFGFHNNAETDLNITTISASFVDPRDYSYHVDNFTSYNYNSIVAKGEKQTFEYAFVPDESFDPREMGLTITIEYSDGDNDYVSTIYNGTIDIVEPRDFTDTTTFFTYVVTVLGGLLLAFLIYRFAFGTKKSKKGSRPIETGTSKTMTSHEMEYLEGIIDHSQPKKKKSSGKPSSGKPASGKRPSKRS